MLKIRRSRDRLIFNMGIPIPGKDSLYIETGPRSTSSAIVATGGNYWGLYTAGLLSCSGHCNSFRDPGNVFDIIICKILVIYFRPYCFKLFPWLQTILGDDQYIFTRLNKVYDAMPSSSTLSHHLFPRPPSPFDGKEPYVTFSSGLMYQAQNEGSSYHRNHPFTKLSQLNFQLIFLMLWYRMKNVASMRGIPGKFILDAQPV